MGNYVINEIYSDGYERFAIIEDIGKHIKINVHFLEYDEYLESSENSQKWRYIGWGLINSTDNL